MTLPTAQHARQPDPNEEIAADQWPLIAVFRENGAKSFHQLGVEGARAAYEQSCARNGLPSTADAEIEDLVLSTGGDGAAGSVAARLYRGLGHGAPLPVALFFHGGGWVMGSLTTHDSLCRYLAAQAGVAVLAVDYRLAPEHPYPAAADDSRTALAWLRAHGSDRGLAPGRLATVGDSAGGHLAAVIARDAPEIAGQLLLYPVVSVPTDTSSYLRLSHGFPLTAGTMHWFTDLYTSGSGITPAEAIIDLTIDPRPVPTFLCTVGNDPLCDDGIAYAGALARTGAYLQHTHLPHHAHGIFSSAGAVPTAQKILATASTFLRQTLMP